MIYSIPDARDKLGRKVICITPQFADPNIDGPTDRARALLYILERDIER